MNHDPIITCPRISPLGLAAVCTAYVCQRTEKNLACAYAAANARQGSCSNDRQPPNRTIDHLKETAMSLGTILLIVLILMLVGAMPTWAHSRGWGYAPSGGLGLVLLVVLVLVAMGRL
jgi:hypothetical protein